MKKIIKLVLISLSIASISSYAGESKSSIESNYLGESRLSAKSNQSDSAKLVASKAAQSGVVFSSNGFTYQLVLGGKAVITSNSTNEVLSSSLSTNSIWSDQLGGYQLSITDDTSNGLSSSLSNDNENVNYKLIAYNSSNGGIGIIQGEIIVKLRPYYSAETIATNFNIELTNNFENISTAIYTVKKGQNIFTIASQLSSHPGVEFAELDVIESFAKAL